MTQSSKDLRLGEIPISLHPISPPGLPMVLGLCYRLARWMVIGRDGESGRSRRSAVS